MKVDKIMCPFCHSEDYKIKDHFKSLGHYPPIYEKGVNINRDKNRTRYNCFCNNCKKAFIALESANELEVMPRKDEND